MNKVLCSVATRGRYLTTLPLVLNAVINQTRPVDKLVVFDDNDEPKDMRKEMIYSYFFQMLNAKGIEWEWLFAEKKGQHHIHQRANLMGYDLVWRCDDDAIPEPNVLENLIKHFDRRVGAVGGSVLTPPYMPDTSSSTGRIDDIDNEPNIQWGVIDASRNVDHLHCTFLYRAGIADYNLGLSRVAHREETLFTYSLAQKGWQIKVVPNAVTWHMKNPEGGIRSETKAELYEHDERIFRNILEYRDKTIVVLNCGLGDHVVFSHVLPAIPNAEVFTCYPEVVPGKSIAEAEHLFGDLSPYNVYQKMDQWRWKDSLEKAYRKLYL
jgi:cellulose synthase/poly-beta-1,6-N-acetylglucosamine synthase-like glycosyltransferase